MKALLAVILCCVLPTPAFAQGGVFENLSPGQALFLSKAPAALLASPSVRLDAVCDETDAAGLALQITDGLARIGVIVDPKATIVLRYEVAPCETDIGGSRSLAQQDAYQSTSRFSELPTPPSQLNVPFGRRASVGARLTLNMLVYKPGQPPMWNALIAARAPGQDIQDYLAQMAMFAFNHWGEGGELLFDLERPDDPQAAP